MDSKNKLLMQYARKGELQLLADLLAGMTQLELQQAASYLCEASMYAAENGHLDVLNRLLEFPEVVQHVAVDGNVALWKAAVNGYLHVVNKLLEFPAVVNNIAADDNCAFRFAAEMGHLEVVNRLLEFPEVVKNITANGNHALRRAAESGHLNVVNRLLEFPEVVTNIIANKNLALRWAAANGHLEVVNRLLEFPEVVNIITADDNYALRMAAVNGHLDVVNRLLEFPAVVNNIAAGDNLALRRAATNGHLDVIKTLVKHWPESLIPEPLPTSNNEILETLILCERARQYYIFQLLATAKKGAKFNSELVRHALDNFKMSSYSRFFANANEVLEDVAAAFLNKDHALHARCQQAFSSVVQTERKKVIFSMIFSAIVKNYPQLNALTQQQRIELNEAMQSEFTVAFDSFVANIGINNEQIYATNQQARKAISRIATQFIAVKKEFKHEFTRDAFREILNKAVVKKAIESKAPAGKKRHSGI